MACDPQTLMTDAKCLIPLGRIQLIASWAYLACNATPPSGNTRITEDGTTRITEDGDVRIIED